jgi:hypothetical protein
VALGMLGRPLHNPCDAETSYHCVPVGTLYVGGAIELALRDTQRL